MLRKVATPILVRLLSVSNQWFSDQLVSCRDDNRVSVILYLSLFFCVSIFFLRKLVSYRDKIWAGVMFLFLTLYFFWVGCVFFALFFFFRLIALFF